MVQAPDLHSPVGAQAMTATLELPARPLMASLVADFGNFGIPIRPSTGAETVEQVDMVKLTGHLPNDVIIYLVDSDSTTYNYENTDLVPLLATALNAGEARPKVESITGGPLDIDDFNNFVNKAPNSFQDTNRFSIQESRSNEDIRPRLVSVENIREVMREVLNTSDIEGTSLAKPWEQASDFSFQDKLEEFTATLAEKKNLAEEFQEAREKKAKEETYKEISSNFGQLRPVDEDVLSLEMLNAQEQALVQELQMRDQEVRAHELAHKAVGGGLASAATFTYQQGPDGKQYAIGGEVQIQVAPGATPEDTLRRANQVRAAATAPANPSPADLRAASMATRLEQQAQAEISLVAQEEMEQSIQQAQQSIEETPQVQQDSIGRLPTEEMTQLAAMEQTQRQREQQSEVLASPSELDLQRETERLTVAAPMGAYAQQFKLEQELDRRAFASLELAQEVAGVPTPQVVEARSAQAEQFEQRAERNASRREEVKVDSPRIDIQPSGSPDVEDARFNLTADVEASKDDLIEETLNAMVDPITEKEQMPQLQSFAGLNSLTQDTVNAMPRSSEGLASQITDMNPMVPQGLEKDPAQLLQEAIASDKDRFSSLLTDLFDKQLERASDNVSDEVSIQGNQSSIEIETPRTDTLFQPERSQLDFSEQTVTDTATIAQTSLDTTGPSRLTPISEDEPRLQLTSQQEQSLETANAVTALQEMFAM